MAVQEPDNRARQPDRSIRVDVRVWSVLDSIFFDGATKQIELYEQHRGDATATERSVHYWEVAFAGTAIMMACAAMEGHANFLLRRSVDTPHTYQNALGVTSADVDAFERLPVVEKWVLADLVLTGERHLDRGRAPFQRFCEAVRRRNNFVAHPKMEGVLVPTPTDRLDDLPDSFGVERLREVAEITIGNARDAIDSAKATVRVVYGAMGKTPPPWAR